MTIHNPYANVEWTLYYDDVRSFGKLNLLTPEEYTTKINKIGPDLLSDVIDPKEWRNKLKNGRIKNKMICDYLMEQSYFSGIGNYLKSDILYICKIKPDRPVSGLSDVEIDLLLKVSLETIRESYSHGGLTIENFWSPDGTRGTYPTKVYNRATDDNGLTVHKIKCIKASGTEDTRTTHWVPEVQK